MGNSLTKEKGNALCSTMGMGKISLQAIGAIFIVMATAYMTQGAACGALESYGVAGIAYARSMIPFVRLAWILVAIAFASYFTVEWHTLQGWLLPEFLGKVLRVVQWCAPIVCALVQVSFSIPLVVGELARQSDPFWNVALAVSVLLCLALCVVSIMKLSKFPFIRLLAPSLCATFIAPSCFLPITGLFAAMLILAPVIFVIFGFCLAFVLSRIRIYV